MWELLYHKMDRIQDQFHMESGWSGPKWWRRLPGYCRRSKETRVLLYYMNIWELYSTNQSWWDMWIYSSSYRPGYVCWWYAHSREVVFHNLHRGQRDTRLCPLVIYICYFYLFLLLHPGSLPLRPLSHYYPPSFLPPPPLPLPLSFSLSN